MVDDHIICPYQSTETFSFKRCFSCKKFTMTMGYKSRTWRCRCQKTRQHKIAFETAALLNYLGMPFHVVVDDIE